MNLNWDSAGGWATVGSFAFEILAVIYAFFKFFMKFNHKLDNIQKEYVPNHGSSLRDAINRIEKVVKDVQADVHKVDNKLAKLEGKFEQHVEEGVE